MQEDIVLAIEEIARAAPRNQAVGTCACARSSTSAGIRFGLVRSHERLSAWWELNIHKVDVSFL